jgi:hypothetical protein
MAKQPDFDIDAAHRFFSGQCFNSAWDLLDKTDRTADEDEEMIRLSQASIWHWTQREDCTDTSLSVGYWQASRIYAVLGQADNARRYGQLCLDHSRGDENLLFYLGYAYEALARAESVAGNRDQMEEYLGEARRVVDALADDDSKRALIDDLDSIALS